MQGLANFVRVLVDALVDPKDSAEKDKIIADISQSIVSRFGKPILTSSSETVAITLDQPKTAALFFDRIWALPPSSDFPFNEIAVFGATETETFPSVTSFLLNEQNLTLFLESLHKNKFDNKVVEWYAIRLSHIIWANSIAGALFEKHRINAVPMYPSWESLDQYKAGETKAVVFAFNNLNVIEEDKLAWKQVLELRRDKEAKAKLRRLRHWLDANCEGKSTSYISDSIATRLEDYNWALKKHGISTVLGTISDVLDPKLLPAASAAIVGLAWVGGEFWGAVASGGILFGKVGLSLAQRVLDLADRRRGQFSEIAFIHEIAKRTSGLRQVNRRSDYAPGR